MNIEQLENYLITNGVPRDLYSLTGGLPSEAYCIDKIGETWEVYYSERGRKSQLTKFNTEESACRHLQLIIKKNLGI